VILTSRVKVVRPPRCGCSFALSTPFIVIVALAPFKLGALVAP